MFAEIFGRGWVPCSSVSYIKPILTHEKIFAVGKKWPKMPLFNPFFLGLGWPWVGEFVGFIVAFLHVSNPNRIW